MTVATAFVTDALYTVVAGSKAGVRGTAVPASLTARVRRVASFEAGTMVLVTASPENESASLPTVSWRAFASLPVVGSV